MTTNEYIAMAIIVVGTLAFYAWVAWLTWKRGA